MNEFFSSLLLLKSMLLKLGGACVFNLFCQIKLADILLKTILPVSFLSSWPPKCLAIQFATTQYIPCRHSGDSKHGTSRHVVLSTVIKRRHVGGIHVALAT